jgi:hypothetical protein
MQIRRVNVNVVFLPSRHAWRANAYCGRAEHQQDVLIERNPANAAFCKAAGARAVGRHLTT